MKINISSSKKITIIFYIIIIFCCCTVFVSFGLTTKNQPEFSSYEPVGTTDMVNLITGDFVYNLPIVTIPGPEGGFTLPLSYHAGIELDEEASWVGLGWSVNAGAIQRSVSIYPDDYEGNQIINSHFNNAGGEGYSLNFVVGSYYWDSNMGHGGTIGLGSVLSVGYGDLVGSATLMGVNFQNDGKIKVDPVGVALAIATVATGGGFEAFAVVNPSSALGVAINTASSAYSLGTMASELTGPKTVNINDWTNHTKHNYFFYKDYEYYLDVDKTERAFGSLYLGDLNTQTLANFSVIQAPRIKENGSNQQNLQMYSDQTISSDMYMDQSAVHRSWVIRPTNIAYDNYNVMGDGVSGNIKPFRLDIGDLPFNEGHNSDVSKLAFSPFYQNYRVQFRYEGEVANSYLHNQGNSDTWGILTTNTSSSTNYIQWDKLDNILYNEKIEPDRNGLTNHKLATSNYVVWYRNNELTGTPVKDFIEYKSGNWRQGLPVKGIGGFSVTRSDGLMYHYALPVYNYEEAVMSYDRGSPGTNYSSTSNLNPYATSWLLTAITGPDFVDRGGANGAPNGVIDDNDWGYWVKFEYGRFTTHHWRSPFDGAMYSSSGSNNDTYSEGIVERYYLDKITTRTHTALFIKDSRVDGKCYYNSNCLSTNPGIDPVYCLDLNAHGSLKLTKIVVLTNENYNSLVDIGFTKASGNSTFHIDGEYDKVIDSQDFSGTMNSFIFTNQIKGIKFNYAASSSSEELCKETLNSYRYSSPTTKEGKLTLTGISFHAKGDIKIIPDYIFEYYNNEDYNADKWDGWGMYNSHGDNNHWSHRAMDNGKEWSLKKIITPLGGEIEIEYDRDKYQSISGEDLKFDEAICQGDQTIHLGWKYYPCNMNAGDHIKVTGTVKKEYLDLALFHCNVVRTTEYPTYTIEYTITSVDYSTNTITISGHLYTDFGVHSCSSSELTNTSIYSLILEKTASKEFDVFAFGGNLNVKKIKVKDELGNEFVSKYVYTKDGLETGVTSGVCSVEPNFIRNIDPNDEKYKLYDYPFTPVLYSRVTVYNGKLLTSEDYDTKTVYEFTTPETNMIQFSTPYANDIPLTFYYSNPYNFLNNQFNLKEYNFNVKNYTSKIGSINSIKEYDKRNQLIDLTEYHYGEEGSYNNIGQFTEGSILSELVHNPSVSEYYYRLFRTTKYTYPNILSKVILKNNKGITKEIKNSEIDYLTGNILSREYNNSLGDIYKSEITPAHSIYSEMGSKSLDNTSGSYNPYKNMLEQSSGTKLYIKNADNSYSLISAEVQDWNSSWLYRTYNNSTGKYEDQNTSINVWRKSGSYVWKSLVNENGAFITTGPEAFEDYYNNPSNPHWVKTSETTRYDNYSHALESTNTTNIFSSQKLGYNNKFLIATCANSNYSEFAYSGAEDIALQNVNGVDYFGGEVFTYVNTRSSERAHTGKYCVKLGNGQFGFLYAGTVGNSTNHDFKLGRKYHASVWLYDNSNFSNLNNPGKLNVGLMYGAGSNEFVDYIECSKISPQVKKFGQWYLLSIDFDLDPGKFGNGLGNRPYTDIVRLLISCWNPTSSGNQVACYFDDFRIHPLDGPMTSYVYDEQTGNLAAVLDEENIATKYMYDVADRLTSVWREMPLGFIKQSKNYYHYARQ
jgi:YD repeat-containing protein